MAICIIIMKDMILFIYRNFEDRIEDIYRAVDLMYSAWPDLDDKAINRKMVNNVCLNCYLPQFKT